HMSTLLTFLNAHAADRELDPQSRPGRARAAVIRTLELLAAASHAHDDAPIEVEALRMIVRRWIEEQTLASPMETAARLYLVDEQSARYGEFDDMTLVGLIEGEW